MLVWLFVLNDPNAPCHSLVSSSSNMAILNFLCFISRLPRSETSQAFSRRRQALSIQQREHDRFVTIATKRTGTHPAELMRDSREPQRVAKRGGINRLANRSTTRMTRILRGTAPRRQPTAGNGQITTPTSLAPRGGRQRLGRRRGGVRGRRRAPLNKNALDQQLNKYFAADPTTYKGQLDRELDEMMQDVSNGGQQQQNI
jgi:hypothetical protein